MARLAAVLAAVVPDADAKITLAIRARRGIHRRFEDWARTHRDPRRPLLWMHAPSVGEGLQARPVLALLRDRQPELQLAYTFFSPSAEQFSRGLDVDFRDYLPFDTAGDMRASLDALRPAALVFCKLDVWPELVRQASRRGVRVGLISATLAEASGRRGAVARALLRDAYAALDAVGAIDDADAGRLVQLGVRRQVVEVTGDTRFDQVWQRAQRVDREARVLSTLAARPVPTIVAGSTWPADEAHLVPAYLDARRSVPDLRLIIAPHEMHAGQMVTLESRFDSRARTARVDDAASRDADVVIVDRFGVLGDLYALADVAFVGGGFHDAGLHSVLEPAAFGTPVVFGPMHQRSRDALLLLSAGAATGVTGAADLQRVLSQWFGDDRARREAGAAARAVVQQHLGAAERSLQLVLRLLSS